MVKVTTTVQQQQEIALHVATTLQQYKDLLAPYHNRLLQVYKELNSFTYPKKADWATSFKVNKMHEISNKILPRVVSKSPKWIVSTKPDVSVIPQEGVDLAMQEKAVQDLLYTTFEKYNMQESVRLRAKSMINYGPSFAKVKTKYVISRTIDNVEEQVTYTDENGEEQVENITQRVKEKVADQYVTIEPVSWSDLFYDPRYILFTDAPAIIHVNSGIRLAEVKKNKDKYINVDKLDQLCKIDTKYGDIKEQIQSITGLTITNVPTIDKDKLVISSYYGLYDLKDNGDERLYEFSVVNGLITICIKEITQIPFEQIRCFEDTETNLSVGFLEPILGLQQEMNYKKNAVSEYINGGLNRSRIWSPSSGVSPKSLINKPNNIIATTKTVAEAMNNLQELPHRELNSSYFQEQNDFDRQIQGLTFTIDTTSSKSNQALTNLATGMKIQDRDTSFVIDDVRKRFEQGLSRLGYKVLAEIAENTDGNITIKQIDGKGFREIHKEAIKGALERYDITIETGSSSYDTIENRREDAIAMSNILGQATQMGVNTDMQEGYKKVLSTFEGVDPGKYIKDKQQEIPGMPPIAMPTSAPSIPLPQPQ